MRAHKSSMHVHAVNRNDGCNTWPKAIGRAPLWGPCPPLEGNQEKVQTAYIHRETYSKRQL